jgi:hypothetical protein
MHIERLALQKTWAEAAWAIAEQQRCLADSPAVLSNGSVKLCAAACVAVAGLRLRMPGSEEGFIAEVLRTGSKQSVVRAFEVLGLTARECRDVQLINDRTPPEERLRTFKGILFG